MHTGISEIDCLRATTIVGIDEAGYGAWAGPLYAVAVAVPCDWQPERDVLDSKRLTPLQRKAIFQRYWRPDLDTIAIGVGRVPADELDQLGARKAMMVSHQRAMQGLGSRLAYKPFVIVDGVIKPPIDDLACGILCLPKADALVPVVSLASIVAKVLRDQEMTQLAATYPNYGFDQHMGYGTAQHRSNLQKYGPCAIHRRSYFPVKNYFSGISKPPIDELLSLLKKD